MKVISFNIGKAVPANYKGEIVYTGIFKQPVEGSHKISFTAIEGDEQADLHVHGGIEKAVYAYDVLHYEHWKTILKRDDWSFGLFGENLTTEGLHDNEVRIGDIYQIGSVKLMALQPRFPCSKLNIKFGLPNMIEYFMKEKRNGIYFKVIEEGCLQVNDEIKLVEQSNYTVTVQDFVECYYSKGEDRNILEQLLSIPFLPTRMKNAFESF